jgi:hypothetical protein
LSDAIAANNERLAGLSWGGADRVGLDFANARTTIAANAIAIVAGFANARVNKAVAAIGSHVRNHASSRGR